MAASSETPKVENGAGEAPRGRSSRVLTRGPDTVNLEKLQRAIQLMIGDVPRPFKVWTHRRSRDRRGNYVASRVETVYGRATDIRASIRGCELCRLEFDRIEQTRAAKECGGKVRSSRPLSARIERYLARYWVAPSDANAGPPPMATSESC